MVAKERGGGKEISLKLSADPSSFFFIDSPRDNFFSAADATLCFFESAFLFKDVSFYSRHVLNERLLNTKQRSSIFYTQRDLSWEHVVFTLSLQNAAISSLEFQLPEFLLKKVRIFISIQVSIHCEWWFYNGRWHRALCLFCVCFSFFFFWLTFNDDEVFWSLVCHGWQSSRYFLDVLRSQTQTTIWSQLLFLNLSRLLSIEESFETWWTRLLTLFFF